MGKTSLDARRDKGYTLVSLIVMIIVSGILASTIAPTWRYLVIRDREEELIFRGEQYKQAIERYQAKFNALPLKLEDLDKNRLIRRLYKDPITRGDFELIYATAEGNKRESELSADTLRGLLSPGPGGSNLPIIGVVSRSPDKALRKYRDKELYKEWEFIAGEKEQQQQQEPETEGEVEEGEEEGL